MLTPSQQTAIFALRSTEYDGAVVSVKLATAIAGVCSEVQNDIGSNLSFDRALGILDGFEKEQRISGNALVPNSQSADPMLAFIGRLIEVYNA